MRRQVRHFYALRVSSQVNYFGVARQPGAIAITSYKPPITSRGKRVSDYFRAGTTVYLELWSSFPTTPSGASGSPTRRPNEAIILGSRCRAEVLASPSRYRLMQ